MECECCGKRLKGGEVIEMTFSVEQRHLASLQICEECFSKIAQFLNAL